MPAETLKACEGLANERLPFHVLAYGDALSVITPELCLETASSLSPLAKLLPGELKPDDFLVTLIKSLLHTEQESFHLRAETEGAEVCGSKFA